MCLRHAGNTRNDEHACAVDYIGNECAPGLTPAALRAALSRVHLNRLPELGASSRVLTVRGVGFEARGPWRPVCLTRRPCEAAGGRSRACVGVLRALRWSPGRHGPAAAQGVHAHFQNSKCQVGSGAPSAKARFPACHHHGGVQAGSGGSDDAFRGLTCNARCRLRRPWTSGNSIGYSPLPTIHMRLPRPRSARGCFSPVLWSAVCHTVEVLAQWLMRCCARKPCKRQRSPLLTQFITPAHAGQPSLCPALTLHAPASSR